MTPENSSAGPLTTDRLPAENPDEKFTADGTPSAPLLTAVRGGHAQQVRGALVVVVETPGGKYRRRTYLTLASAERALRRAEQAGHCASVVLARLVPVGEAA